MHNIGAIKNAWAYAPNEISIVYTNPDEAVFTPLVNKDTRILPVSQNSVEVAVSWEDDDASGIWAIEVSGTIPEISKSKRALLELVKKPCIVVVENFNHDMFILGSQSSPLMPQSFERKNPPEISDATDYEFSLRGLAIHEPPLATTT